MDRSRLIALAVAITCAGQPLAAQAGDPLSVFRSETRTPTPSAPSSDSGGGGGWFSTLAAAASEDDDCCHDHDDDDITLGGLLFASVATGVVFTAPWWGPPALISDDYSKTGYFAAHPYAEMESGGNYIGYMMTSNVPPTDAYSWAGRVSGYYGTDFDSMDTIGGSLLLENASRFGIDSNVDFRHQDLRMGMSDELWTGDVNLVYRFAQSEKIQMRSGIGVNFLSDRADTDLGFNFTYGGDLMIADPWVISTDLDLGYLGEASVTHFRTTLGVMIWQGAEVYTGYDYYEVGDADTSNFISGVRIWF